MQQWQWASPVRIASVRTADFDYELPEELIAQQPGPRGGSRLLVLDRSTGAVRHSRVSALPDQLEDGDLLLLNDTRVIPARLYASRSSGRRFELLLLRAVDELRWETLVRPSARARVGEALGLPDGGEIVPEESLGEGRWIVRAEPVLSVERLEGFGEAPLPPYIRRPRGADDADRVNYQTVYARRPGAVAAPTAGLHFTPQLLDEVSSRDVELAYLTLHVGLGTFRPVAVEQVEDHHMHAEWYEFSPTCAEAVNRALAEGRRIVCVGTTSVRALESALAEGGDRVAAASGWTDIFITPGFEFRGVGALLTNFHLPRSTLIMMIAALAGIEPVLAAYREAIDERYRFFSYGDAMLIV
jgi:S-adenosylmethionine:tRNA ribosyltransferase-isomerase